MSRLLAVTALLALPLSLNAQTDFIRYENCGELTRPSPFVELSGSQLRTFLPKGTKCRAGTSCVGERMRPLASAKRVSIAGLLNGIDQRWASEASDWRKSGRIVSDAGCTQLTINGTTIYWETVWDPWDADSQRLHEIQEAFDSLIVSD